MRNLWCACFILSASIAYSAQDSEAATAARGTFFGVVGHFWQTPVFFDDGDPNWLLPTLVPVMRDLNIRRITMPVFSYDDPRAGVLRLGPPDPEADSAVAKRREEVDSWLTTADIEDYAVSLNIFAKPPTARQFRAYNKVLMVWVSDLLRKHKSIESVQFHNEPNTKFNWRGASPEDYVMVYRPIAQQIRSVRPDVKISVGAISSLAFPKAREWLRRAMDAGLLDFADAISVHPYNKTNIPEDDPHFDGDPKSKLLDEEQAFLEFWGEIEARHPPRKLRLYLTETGYSTSSRGLAGIGSEELQADYLSRMMMLYLNLRATLKIPIDGVWWYDLKDDGFDKNEPQHNYGLITADLKRKKPAFATYAAIAKLFPSADDLEPMDSNPVVKTEDSKVVTKFWRRKSDGSILVAVWNYENPAVSTPVSISIPEKCRSMEPSSVVAEVFGQQQLRLDVTSVRTNDFCTSTVDTEATGRARVIVFPSN